MSYHTKRVLNALLIMCDHILTRQSTFPAGVGQQRWRQFLRPCGLSLANILWPRNASNPGRPCCQGHPSAAFIRCAEANTHASTLISKQGSFELAHLAFLAVSELSKSNDCFEPFPIYESQSKPTANLQLLLLTFDCFGKFDGLQRVSSGFQIRTIFCLQT